jgi:hypothetical protein
MIELTSAIALLVTSLYGPVSAVAQDVSTSANTQSQTAIESPVTLEKYVQAYFAETPILAQVSKCESRFRQFGTDGQVLRGEVNHDDVGLMQINEHYHADKAKALGLDLKTVDGNLAYAKHLYEAEGTAPWSASKPCWNK